jgi:hypothetical protein
MVDAVFYCLGSGLGLATIFFPLSYLAMRSQVTFRGGLAKAWKPFGYSVLLLAVAKFVEIGTQAPQDVSTVPGVAWFLVVPFLICVPVLYFTYRDETTATPPQA